jgi:hypothetical protein
VADWGDTLAEEIRANATRALVRTAIACTSDLKKILSVPAPRKVSKITGRVYAATKATPGAPPRKLTGRGRASVSYTVDKDKLVAVVGTNVIYMPVQEFKLNHKWVVPTMAANGTKYERLLAGGV